MGTFVNPFHPNVQYEWWIRKNSSSNSCLTVSKEQIFFENDCNSHSEKIIENTNEKVLLKPSCQLGHYSIK